MAVERPPLGGLLDAPKLRRQNLKEDVAAYLREMIFGGQLRPGMRIDQDRIAQAVGVSKLPVREALILLQSEGLVESLPRRGAFVAEVLPDDVKDDYRVFGMVASLAAERAAERIGEDDLARLEALLEQMEEWDSRESLSSDPGLDRRRPDRAPRDPRSATGPRWRTGRPGRRCPHRVRRRARRADAA